MAKTTLEDLAKVFKTKEPKKDFHYYGQVVSVDRENRTYEVSINRDESITVEAARLVGAGVGDTVMVTVMANGYATVTGRVGGDMDASDAQRTADNASTAASNALSQANSAVGTASQAQNKAVEALGIANNAVELAEQAEEEAGRASTAAEQAAASASSAEADASRAATSAQNAEADASSASTSAQNAAASASSAATSAQNAASDASSAATSASNAASDAASAATSAQNAASDASSAATSASNAASSASSASTSASNAATSAQNAASDAATASQQSTAATTAANQAKAQAQAAETAATEAKADASTAKTQAAAANAAANGAVAGLAVVQGVVDQLETDVDDMQTHVAMMNAIDEGDVHIPAGLHVVPSASGYFMVIANDGVYVYDNESVLVAKYGHNIVYDSNREHKIGNNTSYIRYYDSNNDGVADAIEIVADNIRLGSYSVGDKITATETTLNNYMSSNNTRVGNVETSVTTTTTNLTNYITSNNQAIENLQDQIDGSIQTWFYEVVPTNNNPPANSWTTTELKNNHLGDLYYDTITGYCYRYQVQNNVYGWQRITDVDVTKALADAAKAQDTADHKRRVFVTTPAPPYEIGDLWVQGQNGDIFRCATPKTSQQSYDAADWVKASKYTDDTKANAVESDLHTNYYVKSDFSVEPDQIASTISATETTVKTYADGKANAAETNAKTYADGKASTAESNAKTYADNNFDPVGSAASALDDAKDYADDNFDSKGSASAAQAAAISAAAADATSKANAAESNAKTAAAADATSKANAAKQAAIDDAASKYYTKTQTYTKSEIEQKAGEISLSVAQEEVEKIEIGGRNLLKFTKAPTVTGDYNTGWMVWSGTPTNTPEGIKITNDAPGVASFRIPLVYEDAVVGGEEVTLSFEYRTNFSSTTATIYLICKTGGNKVTYINLPSVSETEWNKYSGTVSFSSTEGQVTESILIPYNPGWFEIKNGTLKLEKGNKATAWTPAPEDLENYTDTKITEAKAEIKVTTDAIESTVSNKVGNNEVISKINQSAESVKIQANKVEIDGTATFNAIKSKTDAAYDAKGASGIESNKILSMGEQLIVNGNGMLGDNTNFSSFEFDGAESCNSPGSFTRTSKPYRNVRLDSLFPVDTSKRYRFEFDIKSKNNTGTFYSYIGFSDVDKIAIDSDQVMWYPNTLTRLTQDLNAGDTELHLEDASNYSTRGTQTYYRALTFWNYKNSFGYTYPPETYSRIHKRPAWEDDNSIDKTNNIITLVSPHTGQTIPAGTYVSQGASGSTYKYIGLTGQKVPTEWTHYVGYIDGVDLSGWNASGKFPPGTAYGYVGFLWNYNSADDQFWITNIQVYEDYKTDIATALAKKSIHTLTSAITSGATMSDILSWSAEGAVGSWPVTSTTGVLAGDTVRIAKKVSDMSGTPTVYVVGTVNAVNNVTNNVLMTSHGLDTTIIDGGNILTGTVTASQLNANDVKTNIVQTTELDASKITTGTLSADRIAAGSLSIGKVNGLQTTLDGKADDSDIPTKVSDLTNDSGFQNSTQVSDAVSNGIAGASVTDLADGSSYSTTSDMNTAIGNATGTKADKTAALSRSQRIYYRSTSIQNSLSGPTTWLSTSGTGYENWSLSIPQLTNGEDSYPYLYTCVQNQTAAQYAAGSVCTCTPVVRDDSTTVIDGGTITTGQILAKYIETNGLYINSTQVDDLDDLLDAKQNAGDYITDSDFDERISDIAAAVNTLNGQILFGDDGTNTFILLQNHVKNNPESVTGVQAKLTSGKLAFGTFGSSDNEVAYFSSEELRVQKRLSFGNFVMKQRDNGHLSIMFEGGDD